MKRYEILELYIDSKHIRYWRRVKSYPFKPQAVIWCVLNGYVYQQGFGCPFLDPKIKIKEVKYDRTDS